MKIPSYLQRNRYGIFHFRRAVPQCLRAILGKGEIVRSMHTREPREAAQLSRMFAVHVDRLLEGAHMKKKNSSAATGSADELGAEQWQAA